jgi:putative ABC transport system permease protein
MTAGRGSVRTKPAHLVFRALLALYPAPFRQRFGSEMLDLFAERYDAAISLAARLAFWRSVLADAVPAIIRERVRQSTAVVENLKQDTTQAWRVVRRAPGFSLFVVLLMALGIGASTAAFSVVHAVLLRPLPDPDPDRLVFLWEQRLQVTRNPVGGHEFPVWQQQSRSFESLAAITFDREFNLTGAGDPVALNGVRVTSEFFKVMRVQPLLGRVFGSEADVPGHGDVAVLSHRLWIERFGADRELVGRTIELNDRAYIVSGVMPAEFEFPTAREGAAPDLWTPIAEPIHQYRGRHYLFVVGRLGPTVTIAQARTELAGIAATIAREFPPNKQHTVNVQPLQHELVADVRNVILLLFGAVGVVLLVGCCNIANLLLARATTRQKEIAVRAALGAGRSRIVRQLLAEGAILSAGGGIAGLCIAKWLLAFTRSGVPGNVPRLATAAIDPAAIAFTTAVAIVTTLLFGLVPAWQSKRVQVLDRLRSGNKGVTTPRRHSLRSALIVAEVAFTVALSIGAALLVQSIVRLQRVDPGFDSRHVLTIAMTLPEARYPGAEEKRMFWTAALEQLARAPGVESVASTNMVPQGQGLSGITIAPEGRPAPQPGEELTARYRIVSTAYFKALGIRTLRGRTFDPSDARAAVPLIRWFEQQPFPARFPESQALPAAVINDTMARQIWPGEEPVGQKFCVLFSPAITVIGVVADSRNAALSDEPVAEFYLSDLQEPQSRMSLLVRTAQGPEVLPVIRSVLARLDPRLPIAAARTLEEVVDTNLALHRFVSILMGGFALTALVLMTAGVYCVISYIAAQRTHEIGIRFALGATRVDIGRLVARTGLTLSLGGAALGAVGGYAAGRAASTLLFEIQSADPSTYLTLILTVLTIAAVACWIPARRAMRVDAAAVLRNE